MIPQPPNPNNKPTPKEFLDSCMAYVGFVAFSIIGNIAWSIVLHRSSIPSGTLEYSVVYILGFVLVVYGGIDLITSIELYANQYTYSMIFIGNVAMTLIFVVVSGYWDFFNEDIILTLEFLFLMILIHIGCIIVNIKIHHREHWFDPNRR